MPFCREGYLYCTLLGPLQGKSLAAGGAYPKRLTVSASMGGRTIVGVEGVSYGWEVLSCV